MRLQILTLCLFAPIMLSAQNADSLLTLGNKYYNKGDFDNAIDAYTKALNTDNMMLNAYYNRALARKEKGDLLLSISDLDMTIKLNPECADCYAERGNVKGTLEDYTNAIIDYNVSIDLAPNNGRVYYLRGLVKGLANNDSDKCKDYKKAKDLGVEDELLPILKMLINLECLTAEEEFYFAAEKLVLDNKPEEAIVMLTKAINASNQKMWLAYRLRGALKKDLRDFWGAKQDFTKCIELSPEPLPECYRDRGFAKVFLEDFSSALVDLNKAIELNPEDGYAFYFRGMLFLSPGDTGVNNRLKGCIDLSKAGELGHPKAYATIKDYCN